MSLLPPLMLQTIIKGSSEQTYDDVGAYQWQISLNVDIQNHGSPDTPNAYFYDGTDVQIGDWVSDQQSGYALQIVQIISQQSQHVLVIAEDIDRYNRLTDLSGNFYGALSTGSSGYIYRLSEDGLPACGPAGDYFLPQQSFQVNLVARFAYRNKHREITIYQPSHGLIVGNTVYIDNPSGTGGVYKTLTASRLYKNYFDKIVGIVTEIGIPSPDHFTFKPRGAYQTPDLSSQLPIVSGDTTGVQTQGKPVYLDPNTAGGFTLTKPTIFALPLYVWLTNGDSIFLEGGGGAAASSGPLGYYTTTYNVANITARNAIDVTGLEVGDLCYVQDDGTGHWVQYIVSAQDPTTQAPTWTILVQQSASTTDAKTATYTLTSSSPSSFYLCQVAPGSSVTQITIAVTTAFATNASLLIGDATTNSDLVADSDSDLSIVGTYKIYPQFTYSGQQYTQVNGYFTVGSSTTGQATITVSFV